MQCIGVDWQPRRTWLLQTQMTTSGLQSGWSAAFSWWETHIDIRFALLCIVQRQISEAGDPRLAKKGLTLLPRVVGCSVGRHRTINTWQALYPCAKGSLSRTYHGRRGLTPKDALVVVMVWVFEQHIETLTSSSASQCVLRHTQHLNASLPHIQT